MCNLKCFIAVSGDVNNLVQFKFLPNIQTSHAVNPDNLSKSFTTKSTYHLFLHLLIQNLIWYILVLIVNRWYINTVSHLLLRS